MKHLNLNPQYVVEVDTLNAFSARIEALTEREAEINSALAIRAASRPDAIARAAALLNGTAESGGTEREEIAQIGRDRETLRQAVEAQRAVIERMEVVLSREACDTVRDKHREIAAGMAEALLKFDSLLEVEESIKADLSRQGYRADSLGALEFHQIGRIKFGDEGLIARKIAELKAYGKRFTARATN